MLEGPNWTIHLHSWSRWPATRNRRRAGNAVGRRPRVVDEPVRRALRVRARAAEEEHDVIRVLLNPGLVEEEEVARLGLTRVAADQAAVELLERARVGELGEGSVREVRFAEGAGGGAEEFFADGAAL